MDRTTAWIAALVLLAAGGLLLFGGSGEERGIGPESGAEPPAGPEGDGAAAAPAEWPAYSRDDLPFTLRHPPEATVDRIDPAVEGTPSRLRVRRIGPGSGEATEITDGFTFYVRVVRTDGSTSVRDVARRILARQGGGGAVDTLVSGELGGRRAVRFSTRSELGSEVRHVVLRGSGDAAFAVSYVIAGPPDRSYESQVRSMIRSLELTPRTGRGSADQLLDVGPGPRGHAPVLPNPHDHVAGARLRDQLQPQIGRALPLVREEIGGPPEPLRTGGKPKLVAVLQAPGGDGCVEHRSPPLADGPLLLERDLGGVPYDLVVSHDRPRWRAPAEVDGPSA